MKFSRREFFVAWILPSRRQQETANFEVLEVFKTETGPSALLVHHASPDARSSIAEWLRKSDGSPVRLRKPDGITFTGRIFRVKMCFGRGLILTDDTPTVRVKDTLRIDER